MSERYRCEEFASTFEFRQRGTSRSFGRRVLYEGRLPGSTFGPAVPTFQMEVWPFLEQSTQIAWCNKEALCFFGREDSLQFDSRFGDFC